MTINLTLTGQSFCEFRGFAVILASHENQFPAVPWPNVQICAAPRDGQLQMKDVFEWICAGVCGRGCA
jgi:hypothetical protein